MEFTLNYIKLNFDIYLQLKQKLNNFINMDIYYIKI